MKQLLHREPEIVLEVVGAVCLIIAAALLHPAAAFAVAGVMSIGTAVLIDAKRRRAAEPPDARRRQPAPGELPTVPENRVTEHP